MISFLDNQESVGVKPVLRQNVVLDKRIVFYLGSPLRFGIAGGFDGWWKLHAGKGSEKGLCLGYDTGKE